MCTERWYLGNVAIACVEMQGTVKRARNTGDTSDDIILDYSNTYEVHAITGRVADTGDEALKFAAQDVDFTQFFDEDDSASSLVTSSLAAVAVTLYAITF